MSCCECHPAHSLEGQQPEGHCRGWMTQGLKGERSEEGSGWTTQEALPASSERRGEAGSRHGRRTLKWWGWSQWRAGWNWALKTNDKLGKLHFRVGSGDTVSKQPLAAGDWSPRSWLRLWREGSLPGADTQGDLMSCHLHPQKGCRWGKGLLLPRYHIQHLSPPRLTETLSQGTDPLPAWSGQ